MLRTLFTSPCLASPYRVIKAIVRSYSSSYSQLASLGESKDKPQHHDLASFKAYAESTGLDPASTVYRGTVYEYIASRALFHKNMQLNRIGGKSDHGVDLRGEWYIPLPPPIHSNPESDSPPPELPITQAKSIRIIIQCKGHTTVPLRPSVVRELSGTLSGELPTTIGFLASMNPCTNGTRNAIRFMRKPMGYVCISEKGVVKQLVWNRIAAELVGSGMGVAVRYMDPETGQTGGDGALEQEAVLMFNGEVVDGLLYKELEVEKQLSSKAKRLLREASKKASKKASRKANKRASKKACI